MKGSEVIETVAEDRSIKLEKIRAYIRRQVDKCLQMKEQSNFSIKHEAGILLSKSEQKAMRRQIQAYRGPELSVKVFFGTKTRKTKPTVTVITIDAGRKSHHSRQ